jgi:molecular chaperone GrpE
MSAEESITEESNGTDDLSEVDDEEVAADAELVEEDLDEFGQLAKERDDFREMAQRLQADFENYRKRVERQSADLAARLVVNLVTNLLPVLDALDLAQAHLGEEADQSIEATALIQARSLFFDTLSKQGLALVPGQGEPFDPQFHDAVAHAEGDGSEDGQVIDEVLRAGYTWQGAVVRPAMVRVKG